MQPQINSIAVVHRKNLNRRAPHVRESDQDRAFQLEMLGPFIAPRIE